MKPNLNGLVASIVFSLSLAGCNSNDKDPEPDAFVGVWSAPAYGYILEFYNANYRFYQYTSDYCQQVEISELIGADQPISRAALTQSLIFTNESTAFTYSFESLKSPPVQFDKNESLPATCTNGGVKQVGEPGYVYDPERDFEVFWQTFHEHYSFFELKGVDWQAQKNIYQPQVDAETDEESLFYLLAEMIEPLQDGHTTLISDSLEHEYSGVTKTDFADKLVHEFLEDNHLEGIENETQYLALIEYMEQEFDNHMMNIAGYGGEDVDIKTHANDEIIWFTLNDNIGYLFIGSMEEYSEGNSSTTGNIEVFNQVIEQVFEDFSDTVGLIIDIRTNGGGDDTLSQAIASRFINSARLVYSKQARSGDGKSSLQEVYLEPSASTTYTKPIALLTSNGTASAAEIFTLMMKSIPTVTQIGEATSGELSDMLPKKLPNGMMFTLSNEFYYSHDGEWYEHVGIPPEHKVEFFEKEDREQGRDPAIEKAIAVLSGG